MAFHMQRSDFRKLDKAPPDPIMLGAQGKRPVNYNSATGRVLFHQNHMPIGEHAGKIMERVNPAYLLWVHSQPWSKNKNWFPVWSYVDRHHHEITERAAKEGNKKEVAAQ